MPSDVAYSTVTSRTLAADSDTVNSTASPSVAPASDTLTAASSPGPRTVVEMCCDSTRPSSVQIAPSSSHGRHASSDIVTSPSESGSISNSHTTSPPWPSAEWVVEAHAVTPPTARTEVTSPTERVGEPRAAAAPDALPSTGRTEVTSPPSTSTPRAPTFSTASLNPTRTLIAFDPSCCAGCDANHARNGIRTPCSWLDDNSLSSTV